MGFYYSPTVRIRQYGPIKKSIKRILHGISRIFVLNESTFFEFFISFFAPPLHSPLAKPCVCISCETANVYVFRIRWGFRAPQNYVIPTTRKYIRWRLKRFSNWKYYHLPVIFLIGATPSARCPPLRQRRTKIFQNRRAPPPTFILPINATQSKI